ncbi:MAG: helix-turn-helix transcriptional regulator [Lachnospiraceae bacterium]|nr:helix-turn-helix transcriptional regulator [Lachnospiraceae bacterium]
MPDNARETFVRNLRYLMDARGITQADICRELEVSSATASDWCTGKKYPRIDKMQRLADLLGVRYSTLTTETGRQDYEDQQRLEALHQNPRLGLLFDRSRKMSHEDVETMLAVAASILKERDGDD